MKSVCESGHSQKLESVRGSGLHSKQWNELAKSRRCHRDLPALLDLSLDFTFDQHGEGETTELSSMIAHAASLTSLRVSFDHFSEDDPSAVVHLPHVIGDGTHLRCLHSLSLTAVKATEKHLRNLVQTHSQTLRSLQLSNIDFVKAATADEFGPGSWIRFIQFLHDQASLHHVRFDGQFTNGWNEAWVTYDAGCQGTVSSGRDRAPRQYAQHCLRYRIERYVTARGANPFVAKNKTYAYAYHLPWDIQEDASWRFEGRLLW